MTTFSIGEEVLYDDERFVIAAVSEGEPPRYRLLATTPKGTRFVWALPQELHKMSSYTKARDDTANYR